MVKCRFCGKENYPSRMLDVTLWASKNVLLGKEAQFVKVFQCLNGCEIEKPQTSLPL